jgi:hypothetical protein
MNGGAFRDAGAAMERVAALDEENARLREEVAELRKLVDASGKEKANSELQTLRRERDRLNEELKARDVAAVQRVRDEGRDQLRAIADDLVERLAQRQGGLSPELKRHLEIERNGAAKIALLVQALWEERDEAVSERDRGRAGLAAAKLAADERIYVEISAILRRFADGLVEKGGLSPELASRVDLELDGKKKIELLVEGLSEERDAALRDDNRNAVLRRVMDERDELAHELATARARTQAAEDEKRASPSKGILRETLERWLR